MPRQAFGSHNDYHGLQEALEAIMDEPDPDAEILVALLPDPSVLTD